MLVAVAYYLGARLGEQLRFLPVTTSVLWPPNAILTATLLLTRPRRWWIYLLAALPGAPGTARRARRVAGPGAVRHQLRRGGDRRGRRWADRRAGRFDTFRRIAAFIISAGLVAPFVSSFPDAAFVPASGASRTGGCSDALLLQRAHRAHVVPPSSWRSRTAGVARHASLRRRLEAVGLAVVPFGMWTLVMLAVGIRARSAPRPVFPWPYCSRRCPGRRSGSGRAAPASRC